MATYRSIQSANRVKQWALLVAILAPLVLIGLAVQWMNGKAGNDDLSVFLAAAVALPISLWIFGIHRRKVEHLTAIVMSDDGLLAQYHQDAYDDEVGALRKTVERSYRAIAAAERQGEWGKAQELRGKIAVSESRLRELGA